MVGFDIQKELSFLGKGALYAIHEINPKNCEEFEAIINSLSKIEYIVLDFPCGINTFNISLHRYADLIVLPTDTNKLDLFKIKALSEILIAKEITTINKLCMLPNMRIGNEKLSKKGDYKALVASLQIKTIAPLIVHSQALRKMSFFRIDSDVLYKCRETFNYLLTLNELR